MNDTALVYPWIDNQPSGGWGQELRYSLRSARAHGFTGRIYILSSASQGRLTRCALPDYLDPDQVHQIEAPGYTDALRAAAQLPEDPFIWMNDDLFFLDAADLRTPRAGSDLTEIDVDEWADSPWRRNILKCGRRLHELGKPTRNFDIHAPYLFERAKFAEILEVFGDQVQGKFPMATAYYNYWQTPTRQPSDLCSKSAADQLRPSDIQGNAILNLNGPVMHPESRAFLQLLYRNPAPQERLE